jgi:hypothetical protein
MGLEPTAGMYAGIQAACQRYDTLEKGWNTYKTEINPAQAIIMETSANVYTYEFGVTSEGTAEEVTGDKRAKINSNYIGNTIYTASFMAHAVVHQSIIGSNSIYEETVAAYEENRARYILGAQNYLQQYNIDFSLPKEQLEPELNKVQRDFRDEAKKLTNAGKNPYPYDYYGGYGKYKDKPLDIFPGDFDKWIRFKPY